MENIHFDIPLDFEKRTNIYSRLVFYEAIREDELDRLLDEIDRIINTTDDEAKRIYLLSEHIRLTRTERFYEEIENLRYKLYHQIFTCSLREIDHYEIAKEIFKQYCEKTECKK